MVIQIVTIALGLVLGLVLLFRLWALWDHITTGRAERLVELYAQQHADASRRQLNDPASAAAVSRPAADCD